MLTFGQGWKRGKRKKVVRTSVKWSQVWNWVLMLWIKTQRVKSRNNPCIGVTQENSIEFPVQSSLPYILVPMVHANYCAPYPKWPWVLHEVSICCPCYMTLLCSRTFYFILLNPVISLVTMPSNCDWCDDMTDNP